MKRNLLRAALLLLALLLLLSAAFIWAYFNGLSEIEYIHPALPGQIKVACVGDSITFGYGCQTWPEESYPSVLQELLGRKFHVNNYGVSAFSVQDSADLPYRSLPHYRDSLRYNADILVFMMGSNDTKRVNWQGVDAYTAALESILDSYGDDVYLILCTSPSAFVVETEEGVPLYEIRPSVLEQMAEAVRALAEERGCRLVDIHALTAANPGWFRGDGLHPDAGGYAAIAGAVYEAIREVYPSP